MAMGLLPEEAELVRREGRRAGGAKGVRGMGVRIKMKKIREMSRRARYELLLAETLDYLGHRDHCLGPDKCSCGSDELRARIKRELDD